MVADIIGTNWNENNKYTATYLDLDPPGDTNPWDNNVILNSLQRFGTWILIFT